MPRFALLAAALALAACRPASSAPERRALYPMADAPPPPPVEHCFRERIKAPVRAFELYLRMRFEPAADRVISLVSVRGERADEQPQSSTVMTVDGNNFTSLEKGADGEAQGEGTFRGPAWRWTGWQAVTHRAGGVDEHADATVTADGLRIDYETRRDGAVTSSARRDYTEVACVTLGADPIETLYPTLPPP